MRAVQGYIGKWHMYAAMKRIGDTFEANTYYRKNWVENRIIMHTAVL